MRIAIDIDGRYERTPDGAVWVKSGCVYDYWARLLEVFDEVRLVARVKDVESVPDGMHRVDGEGVHFAGVPFYLGLWQYVQQANKVTEATASAFEYGDAYLLCAGPISIAFEKKLREMHYPYAVRVVGDPYNSFAPGAFVHPLRPFLRFWLPHELKRLCKNAFAAWYVTDHALQHRYPCRGFSVGCSDVDLSDDAFATGPRPKPAANKPTQIILVGSLAQLYKAPNVLIDAVAKCVHEGLDLKLSFVGDGKYLPELRSKAQWLDIGDRVTFHGQLHGQEVRDALDKADLFVLPSFQEGLPRAMLEAMARGLPCIGSSIGGIPELLSPEDLVRPGDVDGLAQKIRQVVSDSDRMARMSERNLAKSHNYHGDVLKRRWLSFYRYVRESTEAWLKAVKE